MTEYGTTTITFCDCTVTTYFAPKRDCGGKGIANVNVIPGTWYMTTIDDI